MVLNIFEAIRDEYIGEFVYVKNSKGEMTRVKITRVDIFCSKRHANINVHTEYAGSDRCYNLQLEENQRNYYTSYLPPAFLTHIDYERYYETH